MKIAEFVQMLESISKISSRNSIAEFISRQFYNIDKNCISSFFYLLQGRLGPKYLDIEYNFSDKLVIKSFDVYKNEVLDYLREYGDLGDVVMKMKLEGKLNQVKSILNDSQILNDNSSILDLLTSLQSLAGMSGKGSQEKKLFTFLKIISSVSPLSAKYIVRIILGDLRLGISEKTILESFSFFLVGDKSLKEEINYAYGVNADLSCLANKIFDIKDQIDSLTLHDIRQILKSLSPKIGIPVLPKLVERELSPDSVWNRIPSPLVQPKLDGLRGQIHYDGKNVYIYTRNLENVTNQFPEIVQSIKKMKVSTAILDAEIVSFNPVTMTYGSYQQTMQRKRKYDIDKFSDQIPVVAMCFDVIYLNGENLLHCDTLYRYQKLLNLFSSIQSDKSVIKILETYEPDSCQSLTDLYYEFIDKGFEGIIVKNKQSVYEPGTRNFQWIKLKYNALKSKVDTLDLVVMGYYYGSGSRAKSGIGALLCGVIDQTDEKFYSIAKIGSGFSDELIDDLVSLLSELKIDFPDDLYVYGNQKPDVWIKPSLIVEVDADEITRSPIYLAGINRSVNLQEDDTKKGLSLRFPRIKKIRYDKSLPNTVDEVLQMYKIRKSLKI